ncbi:hypothetical protein V1358_05880 [Pseudoalteromonas sp. YIC-656]|uniref:hypothetical protein n=1 Tax=Pseudoalteromonas pernae TaxID=3118054 RepID=UPI00324291C9
MEPNYPSYSLEELHEALATIDKNAHPERLVTIQNEIQKRSSQNPKPSEQQSKSREQKKLGTGGRIFVFAIAAIIFYLGVTGYLDGVIAGKSQKYTREEDSFMYYTLVLLYTGLGSYFMYFAIFAKDKKVTTKV